MTRLCELEVDSDQIAELCEEYGVERPEVFGSFIRGDAAPGSELDILVTLEASFGLPSGSADAWLGRAFAQQVLPSLRTSIDGAAV